MKKIFVFIFIIYFFGAFVNKVFSFGLDFDGSNFYSRIAEIAGELDSKLYTIELNGDGGSNKKINQILGKKCLNSELQEKEVKRIASGDSGILVKKISDNCKTKDGKIGQNLFLQLESAIKEVDSETKIESVKKSNRLQDISKVGIYTDGINENSPFDLVGDIELIDEIIFEKTEEYDFEGEENIDLSKKIYNSIKRNVKEIENKNNIKLSNPDFLLCKMDGDCNTKEDLEQFLCEKLGDCNENKSEIFRSLNNTNQCKINESGLKDKDNSHIESLLSNDLGPKKNMNDQVKNNSRSENKNKNLINLQEPKSNYKKLNDNKSFPCNNFFCIDISFDTYNHNLLGGWENKYPSIEFLLNRSNDHLKKFANSSLVQSKMTINNFELGLKDIDFSEMFHMSFNISSRPVPILDLNKDIKNGKNKEGGKDHPIYSYGNQLKEYYKSHGLDYERQNDLSLFSIIEAERLAAEHSGFLKTSNMAHLLDDYYSKKSKRSKKTKEFERNIEEKVRTEIISDFELQFKEIEGFSKNLNEYVVNLDALLDNMLKIKIDKGVN